MMNFILKPSLEHIALVKIATTLWNQPDIRNLIASSMRDLLSLHEDDEEKERKWKVIEDTVMKKASDISMPNLLEQKLLHFTKPVGLQILSWLKYHKEYFSSSFHLPREFCWTPIGIINLKKTAEKLIKDGDVHAIARYKFACIYCLEDDILEMWNKLSEYHRRILYKRDPVDVKQHILWAYYIQSGFRVRDYLRLKDKIIPFELAFQFRVAAQRGNKAAVEYFFQKMVSEEREKNLMDVVTDLAVEYVDLKKDIPQEYLTDVLCFLLSQMNEKQQVKVIVLEHYKLYCFLLWPWQSLFGEIACYIINFFSEELFPPLLLGMINHIKEYNDDEYYKKFFGREIFAKIWRQSPESHKVTIFKDTSCLLYMLTGLFEIGQLGSILLLLQDATLLEKRKIISSDWINMHCITLMECKNWDLLEFIIQKIITSKEKVLQIKREILNYIEPLVYFNELKETYKRKCDKVFRLLDDSISGHT